MMIRAFSAGRALGARRCLLLSTAVAVSFGTLDASRADAQCTVTAPPRVVGRRATLDAPLVLTSNADRTAVGWVVPPDTSQRDDDAAAVVLGPDSAVVATLDREDPQRGGGQFSHPIFRVSPIVRAGNFALAIDARDEGEPGNATLTCGAHRSQIYETRVTRSGLQASYDLGATYHCRVVAPERPLVIGVRAQLDVVREATGTLLVLAGSDDATTLSPLSWPLSLPRPGGARSTVQTLLIDRYALEGLVATRVGDVGWYVVFRFDRGLYAGWVSPTFSTIGTLHRISPNAAQVGLPAVANNGREVVVVHAARQSNAASWTLMGSRVPLRQPAPVASQPIAISVPRGAHVFAPSITPQPNGWALSYTVGPLRGVVRGRDKQHVWLLALDAALAGRAPPVRLSDDVGGSDARILSVGTQIQVAYMGGQDTWRSVRAATVRCQ